MRAVIQRTQEPAKVIVNETITGEIPKGLIVYLGVDIKDTLDHFKEDIKWLARKITQMRIFNDEKGKMNQSVCDVSGGLLIISQFTLFANTKKGNRPSYMRSAPPVVAIPIYESFINHIRIQYPDIRIGTGIFGADMKVTYTNDGPVTIILDSKNRDI